MLSHCHIYSVKNILLISNRRFLPALLVILISLSSISCSPQARTTTKSLPQTNSSDIQALKIFTDRILITLATHDLNLLTKIATPNQSITGYQIATNLMGPKGPSILLSNWNADLIEITIEPDKLNAQAKIDISFRYKPNRPKRQTTMKLNFQRSTIRSPWQIKLTQN